LGLGKALERKVNYTGEKGNKCWGKREPYTRGLLYQKGLHSEKNPTRKGNFRHTKTLGGENRDKIQGRRKQISEDEKEMGTTSHDEEKGTRDAKKGAFRKKTAGGLRHFC